MNYDQQQRENRRALIDPQNMAGPFERAFFKTVAGPGGTAYPSAPASVYYCCRQKNVSYTETPGNQTLSSTDTNNYEYLYNMEPAKYIEVGSKVWGFKMGAQWFTIDKVAGGYVTHRKYDVDGNLLWSKDHGATVYDIVVDGAGSVYIVGEEAADGAYVRRYDADGTLSLSIQRGSHIVSGLAGIAVDSAGNILVQSFLTVRKYSSTGAQIWESASNGGGYGIAISDSDGYYISGSARGAPGLAKWSSSGAFIRYAAETDHESGGNRVSSRVSESTVMDGSSGRWNSAISTEFTTYRSDPCYSIDHSGASTWFATLGDISVNSCAKWTVNFGFPSTYDEDWNIPQRATSVVEWDISLFGTGNSNVLVCGDRHGSITHQARDADTGDLLWEKDHKGTVYCCAGFSSGVVIGGERVSE